MNELFHLHSTDVINSHITYVYPQEVDMVWGKVDKLLEYGLLKDPEGMSLQEVYQRLITGQMLLWAADDGELIKGVALTEMHWTDKGGKELFVHLVAGKEFEKWGQALLTHMLTWARENKCRKLRCIGRKGWKRFYEEFGWKITGYEFTMPVVGTTH